MYQKVYLILKNNSLAYCVPRIYVADAKVIYDYNFVAPLRTFK